MRDDAVGTTVIASVLRFLSGRVLPVRAMKDAALEMRLLKGDYYGFPPGRRSRQVPEGACSH